MLSRIKPGRSHYSLGVAVGLVASVLMVVASLAHAVAGLQVVG